MQKLIHQVFEEFLKVQEKVLAPRTYSYYQDAVGLFEDCLNGYGPNNLDEEDAKRYDQENIKGLEFCEMFESQILDSGNFSEFLGYFYPKKVACGRDAAKKVCGATIKLYKWMIEKKYILPEEDGDEIWLKEAINYLRTSFKDGLDEYCNYNNYSF